MSGSQTRKRSDVRKEALIALKRPVERRETPAMYRVSLMLVSVLMVALPLVYVAIVAGAGWGVYWYATHGAELFADVESSRAYVLGRFGPLVIGGVLFFFLLKPLLARPAKRAEPYSLDPASEPFLFQFIRELSERLDAPMPRRIDVDLQVNASASFATGLRNLVDGKLALTIGLPLVSGLRLRELTAVLAHEFGHLSQGTGMRFYYLTQTINHWFARVVFARDAWDLRLERWARGNWWPAILVLNVARACVWLSRRILYLLMKVASAASSLMSRQMEFDADRNAVRLCGSASFARSMRALPLIDAASQWAGGVNDQAFREGRVADDYPLLVRNGLGQINAETRRKIVAHAMETTADMYATHPPTGERVACAEELDQAGAFAVDGPASVLFESYPALCQELTERHYRTALGDALDSAQVVPSADVHSEGKDRVRAARDIHEYFLGIAIGPKTLSLEPREPEAPKSPKRTLAVLTNVRRECAHAVVGFDAEREQKLEARLCHATAAKELLIRRLEVRDARYANVSKGGASLKATNTIAEIEKAREPLEAYAELLRRRINLTADLVCVPEVRQRVEDVEELSDRSQVAIRTFASVAEVAHEMFELGRRVDVVGVIASQLSEQDADAVDRVLASQARDLHSRLDALRTAASGIAYPFDHTRGDIALSDYLAPELPADPRHLSPHVEVAQTALANWGQLLHTLLGDIAALGLAAERAMNLEALSPGDG
ncbi:MAG: M48 family metalloprotease [bacterium]|nr:M48 family metalloprotease [bacterium]